MKEQNRTRELLDFIEQSPTCFHVAANCARMLEEAGYHRLSEEADWRYDAVFAKWLEGAGKEDGKFYVVRNNASLIALRIPQGLSAGGKGFHIVATHGDSPSFKVKENPEIQVDKKYVKLNTEKYGGMILSTWLDRPLSLAGRVVAAKGDGLESRLVNLEEDLLVIPNVAVHMNRDMNKGVEYNPQVDMLPLMGMDLEKGAFTRRIAQAAGVEAGDVLGYDLFLYVREPGKILGADKEFILSPRLDDQQCVFSAMTAFLSADPVQYLNVCAVFHNEEVGSGTRQGADSTFLEATLRRILEAMSVSAGDYHRMVAGGFLISADNAHAVHPNHPELADPTNRPYLNGGIVIKYHGSEKYTSDAYTAARMKSICRQAEVPFQTYANRSDITGGSTLGNISTSHVSIPSVDIGLPQLAMHSAVETAGSKDTEYAIRALRTFYSC